MGKGIRLFLTETEATNLRFAAGLAYDDPSELFGDDKAGAAAFVRAFQKLTGALNAAPAVLVDDDLDAATHALVVESDEREALNDRMLASEY